MQKKTKSFIKIGLLVFLLIVFATASYNAVNSDSSLNGDADGHVPDSIAPFELFLDPDGHVPESIGFLSNLQV